MSGYVIMPSQDYKDICDSVRDKTGKTDLLKSTDISDEIKAISGDSLVKIGGYITTPVYKTIDNKVYRLVWQDDFDGTDINRDFWSDYYCISNVTDMYLARADYWVESSMLNLRIKKDSLGRHYGDSETNMRAMCGIQTCNVNGQASGASNVKHDVNSFWGFVAQEGYYECRFKMFDRTKGGNHFAWWSEGMADFANGKQGAEIDFCEIGFGNGKTTQLPHGIHSGKDSTISEWYPFSGYADGKKQYLDIGVDSAKNFITLGILWEDGFIKWYVNGILVDTFTGTTPKYPLMQFLTMYDSTDGTKASEDLITQIDYLKIYKKPSREVTEPVTLTGFDPITVDGSTADLTIDTNRGCPIDFPLYCYANWSDGSRTEHWVQWDQQTTTWMTNLARSTSFDWTGRAHMLGEEVIAKVTF